LPPRDAERLTSLDLVRGVAVLGILPVNIGWFFAADPGWWNPWVPGGHPGNRPVALLTWILFEQKFITLFSILFGAGLAIRFDRARARGEPFAGRLLRRQAVLLVFGLLHLHLLFYGDILTTYALLGSFAWLACGLGQKALLGLCVACYGGACAIWCWMWCSPQAVSELVAPLSQNWELLLRALLAPGRGPGAEAILVPGPAPGELVAHRCGEAAFFVLWIWITYGLYVLACFFLGIYLLRSGVFHEPAAHPWCLGLMIAVGLAVGVPLNVAFAVARARPEEGPYLTLFSGLAAPPLALAYLGLLLRWSASGWFSPLRRCLRAAGRLALTNYLTQSVLLNLLFTVQGIGQGQHYLSRGVALFIVVLIWSFEVALSTAWVRLFRMGPVEWLWRRLSGDRPRGFVRPPGEPVEAT
jgi:uncharacterized protein